MCAVQYVTFQTLHLTSTNAMVIMIIEIKVIWIEFMTCELRYFLTNLDPESLNRVPSISAREQWNAWCLSRTHSTVYLEVTDDARQIRLKSTRRIPCYPQLRILTNNCLIYRNWIRVKHNGTYRYFASTRVNALERLVIKTPEGVAMFIIIYVRHNVWESSS